MVFLHRWVGLVIGLVMLMWCLTGVVMIYVAYPALPEEARLAALPRLTAAPAAAPDLADNQPVRRFEVEMQGGRPIVRAAGEGPSPSPDDLLAVARGFDNRARLTGVIASDQWTVGDAAQGGPLYRYDLGDAAHTWLYVSSQNGKAVQRVDGRQRFWNWLGAVPHWLYPSILRANARLWTQVVIWLSLIGVFLTVMGLVLGVIRMRKGRLSPYRGWHLWHHLAGLVFGLLVLTWVGSGLLSMNPWGLLETAPGPELGDLRGATPSWSQTRPAIAAMLASPASSGAVSIRSAVFDGQIYGIATWPDGAKLRLDAAGAPAPLAAAELDRISRVLGGQVVRLTREDNYYYASQHNPAPLPVLRVMGPGPKHRLYYLDPVSGGMLNVLDAQGRRYRWWMEGLHRLDVIPAMRAGPGWESLMIVLLAGAAAVCATGLWVGIRHLRLKLDHNKT